MTEESWIPSPPFTWWFSLCYLWLDKRANTGNDAQSKPFLRGRKLILHLSWFITHIWSKSWSPVESASEVPASSKQPLSAPQWLLASFDDPCQGNTRHPAQNACAPLQIQRSHSIEEEQPYVSQVSFYLSEMDQQQPNMYSSSFDFNIETWRTISESILR